MASGASPQALWIRTPVIPDATATPANIVGIGQWLAAHLPGIVARWELCAFNNLCQDKYQRLDREWPYRHQPLLTLDTMERLADEARRSGVDPDIVHWSGNTRMPTTHPHDRTDPSPQVSTA